MAHQTEDYEQQRPTARYPARGIAMIAVLCVLVLVVAFGTPLMNRTQETHVGGEAASPATASSETETTSAMETQVDEESIREILQRAVDAAEMQVGGTAGIAVSDGTNAITAGDDATYPAWSTIKVPLSIAAVRENPALYSLAQAAITASDNAAAQSLNDSLPPGAVDEVLAEAGLDLAMNTESVRPEFSTFGQTQWSASDEATFAANMACVDGSAEVLDLMSRVIPGQAYGLGQLEGARTKAGWGPDTAGLYQVRQLGLVSSGSGSVAVGLTALPTSGTYEAGQQMANIMASELAQSLDLLPQTNC